MRFPEYDNKSRFPKKQPKGICRGCRGPITDKRRQTWCSSECVDKFHPFHVKQVVWKRDGGLCQVCHEPATRRGDYRWLKGESYAEHQARVRELETRRAEYDHILPHSEGGLFVVENIRLLCCRCHKERTKLWHAERKRSTKHEQPSQS